MKWVKVKSFEIKWFIIRISSYRIPQLTNEMGESIMQETMSLFVKGYFYCVSLDNGRLRITLL